MYLYIYKILLFILILLSKELIQKTYSQNKFNLQKKSKNLKEQINKLNTKIKENKKNFLTKSKFNLQKKSKNLKEQINKLNTKIKENKKNFLTTLNQLDKLSNKIKVYNEFIKKIQEKNKKNKNIIEKKEYNIKNIQKKLILLKKEYKNILVKIYKNKSTIFKKKKYLKIYINSQKNEFIKNKEKENFIKNQIKKLQEENKQKNEFIKNKEKEKKSIEFKKLEKKILEKKLKENQNKFLNIEITKQKQIKEINKEIQKLIIKEINLTKFKINNKIKRKYNKISKSNLSKSNLSKSNLSKSNLSKSNLSKSNLSKSNLSKSNLSKSNLNESNLNESNLNESNLNELSYNKKKLSLKFFKNKGILSCPIENGKIIECFGKQNYLNLKEIFINNNGVEIIAFNNIQVKVVFEGIINKICSIDGKNKTILVEHGDYYTVYSNLEKTYVKEGDKVKKNQYIGKLSKNNKGNFFLIFQIWHNVNKENPRNWIKDYKKY